MNNYQVVFVASEARDLLSDAIHFQCDTQWSSFHMLRIPELGGGSGAVRVFFCQRTLPRRLGISKNN